jgi:two-component system cell cycle sensor histidine kinase/response regulator CckA
MATPLQTLILEDHLADAELIVHALRQAGFEPDWRCVDSEADYQAGLHAGLDVILADYSLPQFDALRALHLLQELGLDIPFIVVTGTLSEEAAVECIKQGAADYLLKDRLARLGSAVTHALEQKQLRDQKQLADQALRESEARYRRLADNAQDIIYRYELIPQRRFTYISPAALSVSGYTPQEIYADPDLVFKLMLLEDRALLAHEDAVKILSGMPIVLRAVRKDGAAIWIEQRSMPIYDDAGNLVAVEGIARDITERKQDEEKLRRRNRELALLNQVIATSATNPDPESVLDIACRELARAFEVHRVTVALLNEERTVATVVAEGRPKDRPSILHTAFSVTEDPAFRYLVRHKTVLVVDDARNAELAGEPADRPATVRSVMHQRGLTSLLMLPLLIEGEVAGTLSLDALQPHHFSTEEINLVWSVADQAAGALARSRLAQTQQRLAIAIEQVAESVVITDTQGTIVYVNPAFEQVSGYSRAEALGQNPRILKSGRQDDAFYRDLWATITAGQVWHGRLVNKKKDGTLYTEDATITPIRGDANVTVNYVAVKHDITRDLQLEERTRQSQKMEAIGRLAGGIAHDFNNLLTALKGYTHLSLQHMKPDDPLYHDLTQISGITERATALVRQLLTFSRQEETQPVALNLNSVIGNLLKLLGRVIGEDVELITHLDPDLMQIQADLGQMEQVLMNLAINARDAMPGGGKLVIETAGVTLDEREARAEYEMEPGDYVLLTVSDTGIGMSQAVLEHIFEPFFTTKAEGTGLGLATVFGIVRQHGGRIHAYSEPDQGSTFHIYLPAQHPQSGAQPAETARRPAVAATTLKGGETLLLAEDETAVRELAKRALEGYGYTVLAAANADQATTLFRQHANTIALLISDVIMPGITGPALYRGLAKEAPGLKVLFLSGYTGSMVQGRGVVQDAPFLQKPFTLSELALKVREVLDRS